MKIYRTLIAALILAAITASNPVLAAGIQLQKEPMIWLINTPSAMVLEENQTLGQIRMHPDGGMTCGFSFGVLPRLSFGMYYGAKHFISSQDMDWYVVPGLSFKYKLCREQTKFPSVIVGMMSQGWGDYDKNPVTDKRRYAFKAPGFYAVIGKIFDLRQCCGKFGLSAGVSYNVMEDDDDSDVEGFVGLHKPVWKGFHVNMEYALGRNDDDIDAYGKKRGYLNAALSYKFCKTYAFELIFMDILKNNKAAETETRVIRMIYISYF